MCFERFCAAAVAPDARPTKTENATTTMNGRKRIRSFDPAIDSYRTTINLQTLICLSEETAQLAV
ncbi:hypothetical protein FBZ93_1223 [Bradyrhizobium macuxiense]|uniref:Uncharacterized protein n=1 Tax=Bradyrhizobium macuxiense TaxID=1755647 RepID=A0A560KVJ0_9BRAD|nr:hypothetical protein FBZ93_1223 [Bradyrhizobium macuxiense]